MKCPNCGRRPDGARIRCPACGGKLITWYVLAVIVIAVACVGGLLILEKLG